MQDFWLGPVGQGIQPNVTWQKSYPKSRQIFGVFRDVVPDIKIASPPGCFFSKKTPDFRSPTVINPFLTTEMAFFFNLVRTMYVLYA